MSMKAVAITHHGGSERLSIVQIAKPDPSSDDLLIKVHAFSLNPVDVKIREGMSGEKEGDPVQNDLKVLGYDGAGVVEKIGANTTGFKVGDEVYWSGSLGRAGSCAEYILVDYRLVGHKPKSVDFVVASSFALTTLTAWEAFSEKFNLPIPEEDSDEAKEAANKVLLIVAGAGGVGSIAIQLAKKVFKIGTVVATASRADSTTWCRNMGADLVINRTKDWKTQLQEAGIHGVDYIFSCAGVDDNLDTLVSISNPWGHICSIVINHKPLDMASLFFKAITFSWEFMGTRPLHHYQQEKQGKILEQFSHLIDKKVIVPWVGETYDKVTLETIKSGHVQQSSGKAIGKIAYKALFE